MLDHSSSSMSGTQWIRAARNSGVLLLACLGIVALPKMYVYAAQGERPQAVAGSSHSVTWSSEIAPILYKNCTTCHHPGGSGPFSLLTYEDAKRRAPQIASATQSRFMPPWLPEPGHNDFEDDRHLSDQDIATIARWVKEGMPSGDLAKAMPPPQYNTTWANGTPDLILTVERPFLLQASGSDVFREFVLPYPLKQTHYIRAMEIRPGNPQIVHHSDIFIDPTASFRHAHPTQWQDGVPGMELDQVDTGSSFDPPGHFLFWKPDTPLLVEAEGMPWKLDPGNDLILSMHLKPGGKPAEISAQIGLYFTDKPPAKNPMLVQLDNDAALNIPAGDANFVVEDSLRLPVDVELLGVYPHAHYIGRRLEAWAILPNQEKKWIILIPKWNIDRQAVYRYKKPIFLPKGSVVHMHYVYDNSAENEHNPHIPPVPVRAGNRSEDEMAHLWLQVLPVNSPPNGPDPRLLLEEAIARSWLKKDPRGLTPLFNLASSLSLQGKYQEAITEFRHALTLFPDDERILNSLGVALQNSGDSKQAQAIYEQAIAVHPDACDARFNLARLDIEGNQANDAEHQYRLMTEQCPSSALIESGLGVTLAIEGNYEDAKAELHKAIQIDPHDLTALYNLGRLAIRDNQFAEAAGFLETAALAHPDDVDTHAVLSYAYAQSGRLNDAADQLRDAIRISPANAELHALLSQTLAHSGELQQAITEQKDALRLQPNDADGWNNLGIEEARAGRVAEARQAFSRALQLDPGHAQARANLQRLPPS
jgi:Flp pilus assembly protein TadD